MKLDKLIEKIAGLGVPGLALFIVISFSGLSGGAALTSSLAFFGGPFGMIAGLGVLGLMIYISQGISKYGINNIYRGIIKKLLEKGETKESILIKINKYPISQELKLKLSDFINENKI